MIWALPLRKDLTSVPSRDMPASKRSVISNSKVARRFWAIGRTVFGFWGLFVGLVMALSVFGPA